MAQSQKRFLILKIKRNNYFFILIYILITSIIHPMGMMTALRLSLQKQPSDTEMIESFVREFPLMTLKNVHSRYSKCSDSAKKEITDFYCCAKKRSPFAQTIFSVAMLAPEIQKHIIGYRLHHNKKAIDKLFRLPIREFCTLYQWSFDVYKGKTEIPSSFNMISINRIFALSNEIIAAEDIVLKHRNNNNLCLGKKDIHILHTIIKNSRGKDNLFTSEQFEYRFYQKYTTEDVISCLVPTAGFSISLYIPMTLVLLSRLIETYCCTQIIRDISLDTKIKQLVELVHHNGDLSLLNAVCTPQSNMMYSWLDHGKKNIPFLLTIPAIGFLASLPRITLKDVLFLSGIYGTLGSIVCYICSWIPFEKFPGGFVGLYFAIPLLSFVATNLICFNNGRHSWQSKPINWQNIDKELQNNNIFIPEKSRKL